MNIELQRQTSAYGHFREVVQHLEALERGEKVSSKLPFVVVRFPQKGPTPGEISIDLNTLTPEQLMHFKPLFEMLARATGIRMVDAWSNMHSIVDATRPYIAVAKQSQAANGQ